MAKKLSFLVTKSVSQLSSTNEPTLPLAWAATTPSAVTRLAALPALLPSLTRNNSSALSMSPSASVKAFLHSIMGASVLARSSATMLAVIATIGVLRKKSNDVEKNKAVKKGLLEPLLANACLEKYQADAASSTSTNSSSPSPTALTMSLTALARPSKMASAMPRAYNVTALEESSLPGMT